MLAQAEKHKPVRAQLVQKTVEDAFPGAVVRVHAVYDTARLEPLAAEYEQTARRLADLLDDYTSKLRRHRSVKRRKVQYLHARLSCALLMSEEGGLQVVRQILVASRPGQSGNAVSAGPAW